MDDFWTKSIVPTRSFRKCSHRRKSFRIMVVVVVVVVVVDVVVIVVVVVVAVVVYFCGG